MSKLNVFGWLLNINKYSIQVHHVMDTGTALSLFELGTKKCRGTSTLSADTYDKYYID